ncbi:MAG TPA: response regulator transcription factor [Acidimicrobiales bacterium]|nr:response regulator transcription factor [Acidimicrobiales bacterium]
MARVLVVDDDKALLRALRVALGAKGHEVVVAANAQEGLSRAALAQPDVVILDLGLPDVDGLNVVRRIRSFSSVPVIVLSATALEDRKVAALDEGANDYVTKPFGMAELEARIRTALRYKGPLAQPLQTTVQVGALTLDLVHYEASLGGSVVELTAREFEFLAFLARNAGKTCTHQMVLREVWGEEYGSEADYLRVYAYRIRKKFGPAGARLLRSVPGIGYCLAAD